MKRTLHILVGCLACILAGGCTDTHTLAKSGCEYARYFDVCRVGPDSLTALVVISPHDGKSDTLVVSRPLENIICMSSSQVAGLAAIGADSLISAVSGLRYITNPSVRTLTYDIGYESFMDYERILKLKPDVVLAYTVSGAEPQFIPRLRSLGVRVLVLHDHLENHPLARAEYIRFYGALTGRQEIADSVFHEITSRFDSLASAAAGNPAKVKALVNVPYGDAWYIPGRESYMARLIMDAGGQVLGAEPGAASSTVSLERAYELSQEADIWLNPGPYRTRKDLEGSHHAFRMFGPLKNGKPIYNNTLRTTPEGGNDFWESGSVRPDLILEDLMAIFSSSSSTSSHVEPAGHMDSLKYHFEVK